MYANTASTLTTPLCGPALVQWHSAAHIPWTKWPEWAKFLKRINHLLPCKAAWMAIKDNKIIAWHDGPHWFITRYLKQMNIKADFCGLVQRHGCAPGGGPWCTVHHNSP